MTKYCSIKIYGQVQGVFFRQSAKEKADGLGITGFVRNEPGGAVYIEAEGEEKNLQKFLAWCHQGPGYAQVDKVEIKELKPTGRFDDFTIG